MSQQSRFVHYCLILSTYYSTCASEKITYISVEHPKVDYYSPKFFAYINLTSERYGRSNPIYYVGFHLDHLVPFGHNIYIDVYFYELLSNVYKRSFVELHYDWCHLVEKDLLFGYAMRQAGYSGGCPREPGPLNLYNMTINPAFIPKGFPFTRGRTYANFTVTNTKERVVEGHIDMRVSTTTKGAKLFVI